MLRRFTPVVVFVVASSLVVSLAGCAGQDHSAAINDFLVAGIGTLVGTPDTANAKTVDASPDVASTVSVTGAGGAVWTLSIPKHAAPYPVRVTLVPLTRVSSTGGQVTATSGVAFEPDGLIFAAPATLTVTEPTAGSVAPQIVVADSTGKHLELALPAPKGAPATTTSSTSASLIHFSTAGVDPNPSPGNSGSGSRLDAVLQQAELLLSESPTKASPPDLGEYNWCKQYRGGLEGVTKTLSANGRTTLTALGGQEYELVQAIVASAASSSEPREAERGRASADVMKLFARIAERGAGFINDMNDSSAHPEAVIEVASAITVMNGLAAVIGGVDPAAAQKELRPLFSAAHDKLVRAAKFQIQKLAAENRYDSGQNALEMLEGLRTLTGFSGMPYDSDITSLNTKILKALSMHVDGTLVTKIHQSQDGITADLDVETWYTADLRAHDDTLVDNAASGQYKETPSSMSFGDQKVVGTKTPQPFTVSISVTKFDLCAPSFTINSSTWGTAPELYNVDGKEEPLTDSSHSDDAGAATSISNSSVIASFPESNTGFVVKLTQGSAKGTFSGTGSWAELGGTVTLDLKLIHEPK